MPIKFIMISKLLGSPHSKTTQQTNEDDGYSDYSNEVFFQIQEEHNTS
jgi:hypothetical protein